MQFRIVKKSKGFSVEVSKKTWYGKKYWQSYINWFGTDSPFYYQDRDDAIDALLREIKLSVIDNSKE